MILDHFGELNWLAIVVATVAWFAYSALWYLAPLRAAWKRAAKVPEGQGPSSPGLVVSTLVLYFVTTVVIALLVAAVGADDIPDGIALGVSLGVGFGLVSALMAQQDLIYRLRQELYDQKGSSYWLISGVNAMVAWSIVAVILALWD